MRKSLDNITYGELGKQAEQLKKEIAMMDELEILRQKLIVEVASLEKMHFSLNNPTESESGELQAQMLLVRDLTADVMKLRKALKL